MSFENNLSSAVQQKNYPTLKIEEDHGLESFSFNDPFADHNDSASEVTRNDDSSTHSGTHGHDNVLINKGNSDILKIFESKASTKPSNGTLSPVFGGRRFSVSAESMDPTTEESFEKKIQKALENNFLFINLDEESYSDVINAMEEIKVEENTDVIVQGGVGDYFYVIEKGTFDVYKAEMDQQTGVITPGSEPHLVGKISDGGSFGEIALMYNSPRTATVRSTSPAILWALDRVTFRRLLMERTSRKRKLYEQFLEGIPILKSLESYELQKIADSLESVTFEDKDVVIKQGDKGDCFYLIEDGNALVYKTNEEGESRRVGSLTKGDYFGELALFSNETRKASITADGKLKCARMSKDSFDRLLGPLIKIFRRHSYTYAP
ncbi:hypothetical protein BB560_000659 [Smittium megazygosporum]|uniref:cAMP-dependent protein kinase regulatory subunit n=1 Tax=Smittium megazygosporum TaxID=133381 RepID=A0A2T9ZJQ3_9FUNG|nr:hypothetical protein BB560_000659 [Smittium megazygosporum]